MLLVFYGARPAGDPRAAQPIEVHLLVSGDWVVTVRRERATQLDDAARAARARRTAESEQFVVYRILDALTDTFFPVLEAIDDEIDELEDAIVLPARRRAAAARLPPQAARCVALRRVVAPQRDLAARTIDEIADLPGLDAGTRDYFRDVYDHLIRVSDMVDSYRDLLTSAMDVYLSTVSNRLNVVDEAAHARGDDLPADHGADRLLRPELRLARAARRRLRGVHDLRRRRRRALVRAAVRLVPPQPLPLS